MVKKPMNDGKSKVTPEQIAAFLATVDLSVRKPENTELVDGNDALRYIKACDYPENSDYGLVIEALKGTGTRIAGKRILEIGPGPGNLCLELSREGAAQVIGADPSRVMTAYAREKFKDEIASGKMDFVQESVYNLPPRFTSEFDLIVCQNTFHQLDNPLQALGEMVNATKEGGEIHISDFRRDVPLELLAERIAYTKPEIWRDLANSVCAARTKCEFEGLLKEYRSWARAKHVFEVSLTGSMAAMEWPKPKIEFSVVDAINTAELSARARGLIERDPVPHHLDYLISQKVTIYKK